MDVTRFSGGILKIENEWLPLIVSWDGPGPEMLIPMNPRARGPDVSEVVGGFGKAKTIVSDCAARAIAARKLPGPLSAVLVTVNMLGRQRSSSISSPRRHGGNGRRNR